ncbi:unnamed protein product [Protopolystoma xenopodis]|uniref:Uncharacterized protein n=1 Tax=Protopolystoma xenopodis TaxID=117903 RepID=A0A3S5CQR9_9PLAT|nr:unnamed protein product [Protopolystoma xenopodis]
MPFRNLIEQSVVLFCTIKSLPHLHQFKLPNTVGSAGDAQELSVPPENGTAKGYLRGSTLNRASRLLPNTIGSAGDAQELSVPPANGTAKGDLGGSTLNRASRLCVNLVNCLMVIDVEKSCLPKLGLTQLDCWKPVYSILKVVRVIAVLQCTLTTLKILFLIPVTASHTELPKPPSPFNLRMPHRYPIGHDPLRKRQRKWPTEAGNREEKWYNMIRLPVACNKTSHLAFLNCCKHYGIVLRFCNLMRECHSDIVDDILYHASVKKLQESYETESRT